MQAVSRFFHDGGVKRLNLGTAFDAAAGVTFRVNGEFPTESPLVRRFWAEVAGDAGERVLQCLVCGQERPVLDRLQKKVKEIPGGHPTGTSLISAHNSVFESYGLKEQPDRTYLRRMRREVYRVAKPPAVEPGRPYRVPLNEAHPVVKREAPKGLGPGGDLPRGIRCQGTGWRSEGRRQQIRTQ